MAVPATTGQLRTKVSDMEIGDCILCKYDRPAITFKLNDNTGSEIPYTGLSAGNGFFYYVKVAKGLLIGDRVISNTVTWDSLNSGKFIQGLPWDNGSIIPTMTSNTAPSGIASASSELAGYESYKAFNRINTATNGADGWCPGATQGWVSYEFPQEELITQYTITGANTGNPNTYAPKTWTFEGWNGTSWEVLDQQLNQAGWATTEKRKFLISNPKSFIKYRLNITQNNGSSNGNTFVGEIEMMETAGIIRSLTGGVAYADVNGNMTLTQPNPSKGAWPTNNEFDRFLLGFPQEKIQVGKTLEDIFHIEPIQTWCQDTTVTGTLVDKSGSSGAANNTSRTVRGQMTKASWADFNWTTSNASSTNFGFRPVFSYKE